MLQHLPLPQRQRIASTLELRHLSQIGGSFGPSPGQPARNGMIPTLKKFVEHDPVAVVDGEFTVKRILIKKGEIFLAPENPAYKPIRVNQNSQFQVWGVVTYVIHKAQ